MTNFDPIEISKALTDARLNCTPLEGFPGHLPESLEHAYEVQLNCIKNWPEKLVGFKVGGVPQRFKEQYPSDWQVGPIFSDQLYFVENGGKIDVSVFEGGFAAYEAELIFQLDDLQALIKPVKTLGEAKSFVTKVFLGAEIASSPNPRVNDLGPGSIISDFGTNAGLVIGPPAPLSLLEDFSNLEVSLYIDEIEIGRKIPTLDESGPLGALKHLLNHLYTYRDRMDIPDRCFVSSGAVTGVHQSDIGTTGKIYFGDLAQYELSMVKRKVSASV